jgi:hypothetical protein
MLWRGLMRLFRRGSGETISSESFFVSLLRYFIAALSQSFPHI